MQWILGLDFQDFSAGALRFAGWFADDAGATETFRALHVVRRSAVLAAHDVPTMVDNARAYARKLIRDAGVQRVFPRAEDLEVTLADRVEDALEQASAGASGGLIVGRRAPADGRQLVSLGRVARRLIRRACSPLVVVPPDLDGERLTRGPIVLACDLGGATASALPFARALARRRGRALALVHVAEMLEPINVYVPGFAWSSAQLGARERSAAALQDWMRRHELDGRDDVIARVHQGPVGTAILSAAAELDAAMIVCGSRRISMAERIFTSSVGSDLAARAELPVAIIPPSSAAE